MKYTVVQESRAGGRSSNQDRAAWLASRDAVLMVVADGMGGHLQGDVAAQLAIDTLSELFRRDADPRLADAGRFLRDALSLAHLRILRHAEDCGLRGSAAPRTTCIACVVQDGQAVWAHAGDSRLYLIQGPGGDVQRTRDHSLVQRMIDDGILSEEQALRHPLRNRIFSCLGGDAPPHIEVSRPVPLRDGDLIALCSDGAWSPLGESLPAELASAPLTRSVPYLMDTAERAAGPDGDNLTLLAMRWEAPDPDEPTLNLRPDAPLMPSVFSISDADIERAVAEIRSRVPHTRNGAVS